MYRSSSPYNDVNKQQVATIFSFINLLIQPYMFRVTNSPILRSTFWLYIQLLVQCTDTASDRCHGWDNQQDVTNFSLIDLFNSALHISGDKFAHPQEHFLIVYTAFGKTHRLCCRPVPWHRSVLVPCTKSCIYSQKVLLRMGEFVARNM